MDRLFITAVLVYCVNSFLCLLVLRQRVSELAAALAALAHCQHEVARVTFKLAGQMKREKQDVVTN